MKIVIFIITKVDEKIHEITLYDYVICKVEKDHTNSNAQAHYWFLTISSNNEQKRRDIKKYNLDAEELGINDDWLGTLVIGKKNKIMEQENLVGYNSRYETLPVINLDEARFYLVFTKIKVID